MLSKIIGNNYNSNDYDRLRALLTDRERELIAGEKGRDESARYQAVSRVRKKIEEELPKDIEVLREHRPQLLADFLNVVNETSTPPSPRVGSDQWAACVAIARDGYHDCDDVAPILTALTDRRWERGGASKVLSAIRRDGYAESRPIKDRDARPHNARKEYSLRRGVRLDLPG